MPALPVTALQPACGTAPNCGRGFHQLIRGRPALLIAAAATLRATRCQSVPGGTPPDARYWELCSADEGPVPQMVNTPTRTAWVLGVAAAVMASPLRVRTKTSSSFNTPSVTKGREATVFCPGAWAGALIPEAVGEMAAPATPLPAPRESATANVALATAARRAVDQREPRPARRRSEEPAASASASSPRRSVDVAAPLGRRMSTSGSGHCLVGAILHTRCVGESNSG